MFLESVPILQDRERRGAHKNSGIQTDSQGGGSWSFAGIGINQSRENHVVQSGLRDHRGSGRNDAEFGSQIGQSMDQQQ